MDPEKKFQSRSNISSRSIKLTHSDPIKRLKEFCRAGKYYHQIKWDKYANGFMFECEVTYNLGRHGHNRRRVLIKEVRWVETDNLIEGQRVIAAILLDNIGLGVPGGFSDEEESDEEFPSEDFAKASMKAVTGVLNHVSQQLDNEGGNKDPLLSMAGGLIKQMTTMIIQETTQEETTQEETTQEETTQETKQSTSWADMSLNACQELDKRGDSFQDTREITSWADMNRKTGQEIKSWSNIVSDPK